jgi:sortase A
MKLTLRGNVARGMGSALYVLSVLLLVAGLVLVGWPLFVTVESEIVQWSGSRQVETNHTAVQAAGAATASSPRLPTETIVPGARARRGNPARPAAGAVLAKFEIERLGLSWVLLEGSDDRTLDKSIGHVEYTALPGEMGNIGIAGHRNTHFRKLEWIRRGDVITIQTGDEQFRYQVEWIRLFTPENIYVLDPSHGPAVTLVTCFPFEYVGSAPQRFVVRALPDAATRDKLAARANVSPTTVSQQR